MDGKSKLDCSSVYTSASMLPEFTVNSNKKQWTMKRDNFKIKPTVQRKPLLKHKAIKILCLVQIHTLGTNLWRHKKSHIF